jgi:hypothetical protein
VHALEFEGLVEGNPSGIRALGESEVTHKEHPAFLRAGPPDPVDLRNQRIRHRMPEIVGERQRADRRSVVGLHHRGTLVVRRRGLLRRQTATPGMT